MINDSHSEIVARRCLILYLYKQMEYAVNSSEMSDVSENKSVLTKSNDGKYKQVQEKLLMLKNSII